MSLMDRQGQLRQVDFNRSTTIAIHFSRRTAILIHFSRLTTIPIHFSRVGIDPLRLAVWLATFGLHCEGHVVSRVVSLPEVSETLVGVDLLLSGLVLQGLSISWGRPRTGRGHMLLHL